MSKRLARLDVISYTLFLRHNNRFDGFDMRAIYERTKIFSSGNPPSTFRSQIKIGGFADVVSHTRKRPPVSSEFNGSRATHLTVGVGKVSISSVDTHVARCCLLRSKLSLPRCDKGSNIPATLNVQSIEITSFRQPCMRSTYPVTEFYRNTRGWKGRWRKESCRIQGVYYRFTLSFLHGLFGFRISR